ncbi:response regulator transcription factor [Pseudonocardia phyllosphaerae]|uniref:response regulator transcription factor n=1 Tax=Pseudonocardia phyllosphaerae TaxID=3390502 RepID=UPI00397DAC94
MIEYGLAMPSDDVAGQSNPTTRSTRSTRSTALLVRLSVENSVLRYGLEHLLESVPCAKISIDHSDAQQVPRHASTSVRVVLATEYLRTASYGPNAAGRTLVVVDTSSESTTAQLVSSDASGFVELSRLNAGRLGNALERVARGETPIPESMVRFLRGSPRGCDSNQAMKGVERTAIDTLTPREYDVLVELVRGHSNKLIARELAISQHGVKRLVSNILAKLHCPNRTLAVACAMKEGIGVIERN